MSCIDESLPGGLRRRGATPGRIHHTRKVAPRKATLGSMSETTSTSPTSPAAPAIHVAGLRVDRGARTVIEGLAFTVPAGQVTGLLGPSGCGKSTLMRSIVGVQRGVSGTIEVLGAPAGAKSLRATVGYVTQQPSVFDDLTVRENLTYFARILRVGADAVDQVLQQVDLATHASAVTRDLSGGQRSRVSLAVALLGEPRLLVLDEPTVGLDPVLRRQLWDLFHRLAAAGTTVLVSSHVMDEANRCDRLLLMRDGALIADATPAEVLASTHADTIEDAFLELVR